MQADWITARLRIEEHIAELETWLKDNYTDGDDLRLVVCLLSKAQANLKLLNALLAARNDSAALTRMAHERGCELIRWGWVWQ